MNFIMPFLITILGTGFYSVLFKKKFEIVLPLFLMSLAIFNYALTVINLFDLSYWLILIFSFIFPLYLIYLFIKNKDKFKESIKYFITPGLFMYVLLYTFIYILNLNRGFNTWDEFSHWGMMVKETMRLKGFYNAPNSILTVHPDYPPIITLFQSFWCTMSGGYRESLLYTSTQILGLSLIFPFISTLKYKSNFKFFFKFILIFIIIITIPILITVGEAAFYSTIYTDAILGLLIGYGFALITVYKKYDKFLTVHLSILFSFIILTKQIAIMFVFLMIGNHVINLINTKKIDKKYIKKNYKKILFNFVMLIIVPLLMTFIWMLIVKSRGIEGQFNVSDIKIFKMYDIYKGSYGEPYQKETISNFINTIYHAYKSISLRFVNLTYFESVFVSIILIYLLGLFSKEKSKTKFHSLSLFIIVSSALYMAVLLLLYVFCFGSYEGPNLASFGRYINTFILSIYSAISMIYLYYANNNKSLAVFWIPLILIYTFWLSETALNTFKPALKYSSASQVLTEETDYIKKYNKDKNTYIVAQCTNGYETFLMQYLLHPTKINLQNYSIGDKCYEGDIWTKEVKDWFDNLKDYEYLYVYNYNDDFKDKYGKYFDNLENKRMYKIDIKNKKINIIDN